MELGNLMHIKPFEEHKDQLFTDYAMQLFNAHCSENSHEMIKFLINSLEEEAKGNDAFFPGLVFGCMVHMLMMMQIISLEKESSIDEANSFYSNLYQKNRKNLSMMLGNRPDYARDILSKIEKEDL
jgi:hypothetical protein